MQVHLKSKSRMPLFRSAVGIGINLRYAIQRGVDPEEVLKGTGFTIEQLDDPEVLMSPKQGLLIMSRILDRLDEPDFGLNVVHYYNAGVHGQWAIAAMYCDTVLEAFQLAMRYAELSITYFQFELKTKADRAYFTLHELTDLGRCRQFMHEAQLAAIHLLCREIMGGPVDLHEIRFAFSRPSYADTYGTIFGCPLVFDAKETMAIFNRSMLELQLPRANRRTRKIYEKECDQLLQKMNASHTIRDVVERELISQTETFPTIQQVARNLCMSPRTLARHLRAQGASFRGIAETVRKNRALELLQSSDLTVERIAEQLGYSDVPNFCRAFKRWTGRKPSVYRPPRVRK